MNLGETQVCPVVPGRENGRTAPCEGLDHLQQERMPARSDRASSAHPAAVSNACSTSHIRSLKYMRAFAQAWPDEAFVQEVLAQLPWYHQLALLDKLPDLESRCWYAAKAMEHNWSKPHRFCNLQE